MARGLTTQDLTDALIDFSENIKSRLEHIDQSNNKTATLTRCLIDTFKLTALTLKHTISLLRPDTTPEDINYETPTVSLMNQPNRKTYH